MRAMLYAVCAAAVVLFPLRAAAQDPLHADSPRVTITVNSPTLVGDSMLEPGQYRFQCRYVDGRTFLVISLWSRARRSYACRANSNRSARRSRTTNCAPS